MNFFFNILSLGLVPLLFSSISILSFKPLHALDKIFFKLPVSSGDSGMFNIYLINPDLQHFSMSIKISPKFLVYKLIETVVAGP